MLDLENKAASEGLLCFKNGGETATTKQNKGRRITNLCLCPASNLVLRVLTQEEPHTTSA